MAFDSVDEPVPFIVNEKNTFINLEPPPRLDLNRAYSVPVPETECTQQQRNQVESKTSVLAPKEDLPWKVQTKNTFISVEVAREDSSSSMPPRYRSGPAKSTEETLEQNSTAVPPEMIRLPSELSEDQSAFPFTPTKSPGTYQPIERRPQQPSLEPHAEELMAVDQSSWMLKQKNTFLHMDSGATDGMPPRYRSDPTDSKSKEEPDRQCDNHELPPPPPIPLEYIATDDPFQDPARVNLWNSMALPIDGEHVTGTSSGPPELMGEQGDAAESLDACAELSLERYVTEDLFSSPCDQLGCAGERTEAPHMTEQPQWQSAAMKPPMYVLLPHMQALPPHHLPSSVPFAAPPASVAPTIHAPIAPEAPSAPPSHTPGASAAALTKTELCQPGLIVRPHESCTHVHWAVDARKLERQDKQAVSPVFEVMLPNHGPAAFKIVLHAVEKKIAGDRKKGAGFHRAKGRGRVVLKCESDLPESCAEVAMRIGVGRDEVLQPFRGPVLQNFFENSCHGLHADGDEWNFTESIDEHNCFLVTVEIAPKISFLANPSIWWAT